MDAFDEPNQDPAAEFLAREQEELGDVLGEELGIAPAETNAPPAIDISNLSIEDQEELKAVNQEVNVERTSTPSPAFVMPPRPKEEPETIKQWRLDQEKRLQEKDAKEEETMAQLRDEAKKDLEEW